MTRAQGMGTAAGGAVDLAGEVRRFVADFALVPAERLTRETTLFGDLGLDGDDAADLLRDFGERFGVDLSAFEHGRHFGPEGHVPWAPLRWLRQLLRSGGPEARAGLVAVTVEDLVRAARAGRW